jgi:hypothetical protein
MPFIWDWIWRKLSGTSEKSTQPESLGGPEVDNQVGEKVVRDRRTIPANKGNTSAKPKRVRSNDTSKASRKSPRKAVCAAASKNKTKGKTLPKG